MSFNDKKKVGIIVIVVNLVLCYIEGFVVGRVLKNWLMK